MFIIVQNIVELWQFRMPKLQDLWLTVCSYHHLVFTIGSLYR